MLQPHSMSNFIALPDGTLLNLNGGALGEFIFIYRFSCKGGFDGSFLQQAQLVMAMTRGRSDIHMRTTRF